MRSTILTASIESLKTRGTIALLAWNALTAGSVALVCALVFMGRTNLLKPSLNWLVLFVLVFLASLIWISRFYRGAEQRNGITPSSYLSYSVKGHAALVVLSLVASSVIYLSDDVNHQVRSFWWPTAPLLVVLAVLCTEIARSAILAKGAGARNALSLAVERASVWALPASLLLLGFFQGGSYLWVIGNDFTRYWNVADGIAAWSGYPTLPTLPLYVQIGEPPYTTDLPGYPLALLLAFKLFGHDTLAAHVPNLLANAALPWLTFIFFRGAGICRPIAFAGSAALVTQPFLRLYTLNAPVPDAYFLAILMGTAFAYQRLVISHQSSVISHQSSVLPALPPSRPPALPHSLPHSLTPSLRPWLIFGFLAGLTAITRPEGLFFLAFMGLGLLPALRSRGPWLSAAVGLGMLLPFVLIFRSTFGFLWPNNAGTTIGLHNIEANIYWLEKKTLWWYANAFGLTMPQLYTMLALIALALLAGTIWMARERWKLALLPVSAAASFLLVFTVDEFVSGVHLWFDFFRHISYALPFLAFALVFLLDRIARWLDARTVPLNRHSLATAIVAILIFSVAFYQMYLLSRPSQTSGGSQQLLTSDVWVTFQDVVDHRYQLHQMVHARDEAGVLVLDKDFDKQYQIKHLDSVRNFFEPYSTINTNRGSQYILSSALALLFGAILVMVGRNRRLRTED